MLDLIRGVCGVDGDIDGIGRERSKIGVGPFRPVLGKDGNAFLALEAEPDQSQREIPDIAGELDPGDVLPSSALLDTQSGPFSEGVHTVQEHLSDCGGLHEKNTSYFIGIS